MISAILPQSYHLIRSRPFCDLQFHQRDKDTGRYKSLQNTTHWMHNHSQPTESIVDDVCQDGNAQPFISSNKDLYFPIDAQITHPRHHSRTHHHCSIASEKQWQPIKTRSCSKFQKQITKSIHKNFDKHQPLKSPKVASIIKNNSPLIAS